LKILELYHGKIETRNDWNTYIYLFWRGLKAMFRV
jgi:hypothetical protein